MVLFSEMFGLLFLEIFSLSFLSTHVNKLDVVSQVSESLFIFL